MNEPKTVEEPTISEDTALNIKSVNKLSRELEQIKNATEATEQEPVLVPVDMTEIALSKKSEERITRNILAVHLKDEREITKKNLEKTFEKLRDSGEVNAILELANLEHPGDQAEARKIIDETLKQDYPAFGLIYDEVVREKKELGPELEMMRHFIAEVNASETDQGKLDGTGVEFSDLKSVKLVCDKIDEKMRGLSRGTDTDTDAAIASINELIAQARVPKKGEDSPFKKLYKIWKTKIIEEIEEKNTRRVEALLKEKQRLKDAPNAEEAAAVEAAKKAEYIENLEREKDALQRAEREQKLNLLEGLKKVAKVNSTVIKNELDETPRGEQLPDLKIKLVAPPYIDELVPGNPPDMTREEALIGELKRLTIVMLENKMPEYRTDEKDDEFDATKIYKDSIQLPFNHALRQIIDIYKGTISKKELIEAIKSSVRQEKEEFSKGTIETIVTGMIAEVAVQDVARKEYRKDYVRDSTTEEDRRGSDFFVTVRVFYYGKEKTEDLEFGLDVKTGVQQDSKIQKNNKVVIDSDHIDPDTFSVWPGYVESVKNSIAKAIEAQDRSIREIKPLKDSGRAAA